MGGCLAEPGMGPAQGVDNNGYQGAPAGGDDGTCKEAGADERVEPFSARRPTRERAPRNIGLLAGYVDVVAGTGSDHAAGVGRANGAGVDPSVVGRLQPNTMAACRVDP